MIIQSNLGWTENTDHIVNKASNKLWLLRRLKKLDLGIEVLLDFYKKEIRCLLEYAVPVWYSGITLQQSKSIEVIQRYAVSIILNNWTLSYRVKCTLLSIEPLYIRRPQLALNFSLKTIKASQHQDFFSKRTKSYATRDKGHVFIEEVSHSARHYKSPLVALTRDLNKYFMEKN